MKGPSRENGIPREKTASHPVAASYRLPRIRTWRKWKAIVPVLETELAGAGVMEPRAAGLGNSHPKEEGELWKEYPKAASCRIWKKTGLT